jgi:cell division protease FtsH
MPNIRDIIKSNKLNQEELVENKDTIFNTSVEDIAKKFGKYKTILIDIEDVNDYLEIYPNEQMKLKEIYPAFMNPMVSQAVDKYLKINNFKIENMKNYKWGEKEIPVEYSNMTIKRDLQKNLIKLGYLYIKNENGIKAVLSIDFVNYCRAGAIEITFKKEDSKFFENSLLDINNYINEFDYFMGEKISSSGRLLDIGKYDWDDIVFEHGIREMIESNVVDFFNRRDIYSKNNIPFKRGVILEGPPGTGKTLTSKILANKVKNITFILATAADIGNATDVANLFTMARKYAPSIIFMEDIDFFAQNRISNSSNSEITGELLTQLDGIEDNNGIVVVATTNHQELLDEAIVHRPGRFDIMIHIGELGLANREKLLIKFLRGRQKTEDVDFANIAAKCEGFTGSHIKELANSVCILAINYNSLDEDDYIILLNEHFDEAINRIKKHSLIEENKIIISQEIKDITCKEKVGYVKKYAGFIYKKDDIE